MSATFQYAAWLVSLLLQVGIVALMLRRSLHREFPAFFCYTSFHIVRGILLFGILRSHLGGKLLYSTYFWTYWTADLVSLVLVAIILYDVFQKFFRDYSAIRRYVSLAFSIGVALLLAIAITVTWLAPGNERFPLIATILLFERSLKVVQVGLVVMLSALARFMAIPWRGELCFGIALGFGIESGVELAALTLRTGLGSNGNNAYNVMISVAYLVAVLVWFRYILVPQNKVELASQPSSGDILEWNKALTEMLSR